MRAPLFVLGMHRSGTSAVTGALQKAGFSLGPDSLLTPADENNESGYFEIHALMEANERFRTILGMHHNPCLNLPEDWMLYDHMDAELAKVAQIFNRCFGNEEHEALKDPRISLLLPIYKHFLGDLWPSARALICVRNPLDVAKSLSARDFIVEHSALGVWLQHTLCALRESRGIPRRVIIYDEFLNDPVKALTPILSLHPELEWTLERKQAVTSAVRPPLNHGSSAPLDEIQPDIIARTFNLCVDLAAHPENIDTTETEEEIEGLWSEFKGWWELVPSDVMLSSSFALIVKNGDSVKAVDKPYAPQRKAQTLEIEFEAPKGSEVGVQFSYWPGTVWLRSVVLTNEQGKKHSVELVSPNNVSLENSDLGPAWNILGPAPHAKFHSLGGKQKAAFTFSSWIDPNAATRCAQMLLRENVLLRKQLAAARPAATASFR